MRKEMFEPAGREKTSRNKKASSSRTTRSQGVTSIKARTTTPKAKSKSSSTGKARAGRAGSAESTTDHDTIQQWAESRGGKPVSVKGTARSRQHAGLLRIDFPGFSGEGTLEPISWEEWFQKFEESKLAFLFQDKTKDGKQSRFFKLVKR
jgi:hypothetical protein